MTKDLKHTLVYRRLELVSKFDKCHSFGALVFFTLRKMMAKRYNDGYFRS